MYDGSASNREALDGVPCSTSAETCGATAESRRPYRQRRSCPHSIHFSAFHSPPSQAPRCHTFLLAIASYSRLRHQTMTLMQARCALWRRRASVAQGRGLLAVWDRSFKPQYSNSTARTGGDKDKDGNKVSANAIQALAAFSTALCTSEHLNAHLVPLWGLVTKILSVPLHDAAYLFLFSHARTVISAAVRASVMGPY